MAEYGSLTNIFIPEVQNKYVNEFSTTQSALWQSGIVSNSAQLADELTNGHGNYFLTPFNKPVEDETAGDGDTSNDAIATSQLFTGTQTSVRQVKTHAWDARDLAVQMSGNDATAAVALKAGLFWRNNMQKQLLAAIKGVFLGNIADDSGDMINDIYVDAATPAETTKINTTSIIDAAATMGDHWGSLGAIAMHSTSRAKLMKDEPNAFVPASQSNIGFATYNGLIIIEDDSLVVTAGSNSSEYETLLFGQGAFQYGQARDVVESVIDREERTGNGTGGEALILRRSFVMHPDGFTCTSTDAKLPIVNARLEAAAAWTREVTSRKQIKMAMLKHNV